MKALMSSHVLIFFLIITLESDEDSDKTAIIASGSFGVLIVLFLVILLSMITAIACIKKGIYLEMHAFGVFILRTCRFSFQTQKNFGVNII